MKIGPNDTIADVVIGNSALFSLGFNRILDNVKSLEEPRCVPLRRPKQEPRNIECRDVLSTITMRELDIVSQFEESDDYVYTVLSTLLRIERDEVPHLQFLGAMRYYVTILGNLENIAKMWKTIEIKDEQYYTPKHQERGIWSVVDNYSDDKGCLIDTAWDARWIDVFLHFERRYDEYMTQKARIKEQEAKAGKKR